MKNKVVNLTILFVALALVMFFTLRDDFNGVVEELKNVNIIIIVFSIILFFASLLIKSISINKFLSVIKKYKLTKTFYLTVITQFINGVTPFQTGGQPYEVYLLKKDGMRITDSTSCILKDFISYQIALIFLAITSVIINYERLSKINFQTKILIAGGLLVNLVILVLLLFLSFAKKPVTKFINKIVKYNFFKQNPDRIKRLNASIENFYSSGLELKNNKSLFFRCIILNLIYLIMLYSIPCLIFKSFNVNIFILDSITITSIVMLIGNFIPLPGGIGGIEYGFTQLFGLIILGKTLSGAVIMWRFVTYVLCLIIGFIVLLVKKGSEKDENRFIY